MDLDEMTGSPNLVIVPDPETFRVLPWEPNVGWILSDEYFAPASPSIFRRGNCCANNRRLARTRDTTVVGLEVEWYLLRLAEEHLTHENIGAPGLKGRAPERFQPSPDIRFHSETNLDLMQAPLSRGRGCLEKLELPLRSFENEWGPGQVECTFAPPPRSKRPTISFFSVPRRGRFAGASAISPHSCAGRPSQGYYSSGWHLHQSLVRRKTDQNLFTPQKARSAFSPRQAISGRPAAPRRCQRPYSPIRP